MNTIEYACIWHTSATASQTYSNRHANIELSIRQKCLLSICTCTTVLVFLMWAGTVPPPLSGIEPYLDGRPHALKGGEED
jgi:hypothetical protein